MKYRPVKKPSATLTIICSILFLILGFGLGFFARGLFSGNPDSKAGNAEKTAVAESLSQEIPGEEAGTGEETVDSIEAEETGMNGGESDNGSATAEISGETVTNGEESSSESPAGETTGETVTNDGESGTGSVAAETTGETVTSGGESGNGSATTETTDAIDEKLKGMTLEQKVAQMFVIKPSVITETKTTIVGERTRNAYAEYPVGGFWLDASNVDQDAADKKQGLLDFGNALGSLSTEQNSISPFVVTNEDSMDAIAEALGTEGFEDDWVDPQYLSSLSVTVYLDPEIESQNSDQIQQNLQSFKAAGLYGALKSFPAVGEKEEITSESWFSTDRISYVTGIDNGADFVVVSHEKFENLVASPGDVVVPGFCSPYIVTDLLRDELKFGGIIITDGEDEEIISSDYSCGQAAVDAVLAGVDMILTPEDFQEAKDAIVEAVNDETISEERIDESVKRILELKEKA